MHEDVKFKFISFFCVFAQKHGFKNRLHKSHYNGVRNESECLEMLGTLPMPYVISFKSRLAMSRR
jgi:hypothetical protein